MEPCRSRLPWASGEGQLGKAVTAPCVARLPLLFLIEDNGYAISVPVEYQTAGGNVARLLSGFPGLFIQEVDGVDFLASYQAMRAAANYCRQGEGPALVHARVIRPLSHSLSDDERMYKTAAERALEAQRDPVLNFPRWLVDEGVLDRQSLQLLMHEVEEEVQQATEQALRAAPPDRESALINLYSPIVDPASGAFSTPPQFEGPPETMLDAINRTLAEEMRRDPRVLVF